MRGVAERSVLVLCVLATVVWTAFEVLYIMGAEAWALGVFFMLNGLAVGFFLSGLTLKHLRVKVAAGVFCLILSIGFVRFNPEVLRAEAMTLCDDMNMDYDVKSGKCVAR